MKYLRRYNESFNEHELKEALDIYAEELPFEMQDVIIFRDNALSNNPEVSYKHIDDRLKELLLAALVNNYNLSAVENKVTDDVNKAFEKFARKYDLIYLRDETIVVVDLELYDDNWNIVENITDRKLFIKVSIEFKTLDSEI